MKTHVAEFPVEKMSKVLGVSRSGYYRWLKVKAVGSSAEEALNRQIKASFKQSQKTYGSPRIAEQLQKEGILV